MMQSEGFEQVGFKAALESLKAKDKTALQLECIAGLRKLDSKLQIRCIAWLCVIANADGFMDKEEWILIYRLYHTELKLSLDDVFKTQKELNMIIHGRSSHSFGVKVQGLIKGKQIARAAVHSQEVVFIKRLFRINSDQIIMPD